MSQAEQILKALKSGDTLTSLEALRRFGVFRLAARCHQLRADGHNIKVEMETDSKTGKRFARYWMGKTKNPVDASRRTGL